MTPDDVVKRARSALGHGCVYKLGRGGMSADAMSPWSGEPFCDCSGFAMWCLGLSRFQDPLWYDTSRIEHDAVADHRLFLMRPWLEAGLGDLIVYGDANGHQGHVGVVATVNEHGPASVVHCSLGNYRLTGDAIRETGPEIWTHHEPPGLVARCTVIGWPV